METSENSSASAELTSTQGSVLTTDRNDASQNLVGDSVPSSSSDANVASNFTKTIQDDPISSTSDSVSVFNFTEEKDVSKDLVSDTDFFSSELNIETVTTEKISEDVEDIANDLENLLGETNNDYIIPISAIRDDGAPGGNELNEANDLKEGLGTDNGETDVGKTDSSYELDKSISISDGTCNDKVDSTETRCVENREAIAVEDTLDKVKTEIPTDDNSADKKLVNDQISLETDKSALEADTVETSLQDNMVDSKSVEHTFSTETCLTESNSFQQDAEDVENKTLSPSHTENDAIHSNTSVRIDNTNHDNLDLLDANKDNLVTEVTNPELKIEGAGGSNTLTNTTSGLESASTDGSVNLIVQTDTKLSEESCDNKQIISGTQESDHISDDAQSTPEVEPINIESEAKDDTVLPNDLIPIISTSNHHPPVESESAAESSEMTPLPCGKVVDEIAVNAEESEIKMKEEQGNESIESNKNLEETASDQIKEDSIDKEYNENIGKENTGTVSDIPDSIEVAKHIEGDTTSDQEQVEQTISTTEVEKDKKGIVESECIDVALLTVEDKTDDSFQDIVEYPEILPEKSVKSITEENAKAVEDVEVQENPENNDVLAINSQGIVPDENSHMEKTLEDNGSISPTSSHTVPVCKEKQEQEFKSKINEAAVSAVVEDCDEEETAMEKNKGIPPMPLDVPPITEVRSGKESLEVITEEGTNKDEKGVEPNGIVPSDAIQVETTSQNFEISKVACGENVPVDLVKVEGEEVESNAAITVAPLEVCISKLEQSEHQEIEHEVKDVAPSELLDVIQNIQEQSEDETTHTREVYQGGVEGDDGSHKTSFDTANDAGTAGIVHEITNEHLCSENASIGERSAHKIEMTISSIIEEAIQDEMLQETVGNPTELTDNLSEVTESLSEATEVLNSMNSQVVSEQIEDTISVDAKDVNKNVESEVNIADCHVVEESNSQKSSVKDLPDISALDHVENVVPTLSSETEAVCDHTNQEKDGGILNENLCIEDSEQVVEKKDEDCVNNESGAAVQVKNNSNLFLANSETKGPQDDTEHQLDVHLAEPFENACDKSPEIFTENLESIGNKIEEENIYVEAQTISANPETADIIPDSLDEGNIAALAICEPSNSDYYQIDDDIVSHAVNNDTIPENKEPIKDINKVIAQEIDSLLELQTKSKPIEDINKAEYPVTDETKLVTTERRKPVKTETEVRDETTISSSDPDCEVLKELADSVSDPSLMQTKVVEETCQEQSVDNGLVSSFEKRPVEDSTESEITESRSQSIAEPRTAIKQSLKVNAKKRGPAVDINQRSEVEENLVEEKCKQTFPGKSDSFKVETIPQNLETPKKVSTEESVDVVEVTSNPRTNSQTEPLVIDIENSAEVSEESEILTSQYSSKMSTKELLKMTIIKHKTDSPKEEDSILKIYDPKEDKRNQKIKESIPKLIIKPVLRSQSPSSEDPEQAIPKLLIRNMSPNRPCSPKVSKIQKSENCSSLKVTIKPVVKPDETQLKSSPKLNIKPVIKSDEDTFTPKITIKPIVKPEDEVSHNPKITIKPIVKLEEEISSSPRITIKPIPKPEDPSIEPPSLRITIKPLVKPDEEGLKEDERSHSPRVTIKPIKGDDPKICGEEMVHSPRITIKPIKPPDEEEPSPKITIKPLIKPQEEDRHEKKEGSPKIKIKPIVKPVEEPPELIDFEEQIKQERIVLKINTKESRKREATEEIEKLAKIKVKLSKEGGRAHIVSDQKLKRALEQSHNTDNKRQKIETVDLSSSPDCKEIIEIKDDSNPAYDDPIESIPTFEISAQTIAAQNNPPPVIANPAPRKRGRPRKVPLVVREEFKDPKEEAPEPVPVVEETGRPKRSCRGPSVCTTLGIKPRKPRGGGTTSARGRGRGRGSRGGSRGSNRQQRVTARSKLLEKEVVTDTSEGQRLVVDEIIEIPDDDPKEEEHPPQPLPQTQPEVIEVRVPTPPPTAVESIAVESVTESVVENVPSEGGSDVVLIEEETRMSADIHNSRAQTPAKQVLAVVDIEDTQSSVQSTATTESVKVVRKGSRLEVHQEPECDIISPEQLAEYYWGGSGPYMLQEQVAQFLGIKSFKRKYPGIQRRPVDMQERDFIRESCLASEAMCDMGLTAVASADILDIMYSDFQPKYEEYCKHQRDRHTKDIINKQKALNLVASQEKSKHDLTQQAVQSAAAWNTKFNKSRREERRACMDLQTFTINYPRGKFKNPEKLKVGHYPIALVPGQYTDSYKEYTPNEIYNLPLNTMMNQTLSIVRDDDSQSDGSGTDSDTTTSDSDSTSSDSSDEDCNMCTAQMNAKKVAAN